MELRLVMLLALTSSARTSSAPQESEIVNTHSSKCVDADTDTYPNDGTKLQLWGCGGASQQQWTYTNGQIVSRSGKCVDADTGTYPNDGTKLQLWHCNGASQQQWTYTNGQIVNTHSGKCVDADTDTYPNDGTKLQLWGCNGGDSQSQQWNGLAPIPDCASWPVFQTAVDLAASPWGSYMMDVYGSAPPPDRFPLSVGSWWMLWDHLLSKHKVQLPKSSGTCAPPNCQLSYYAENNAYAPKATSWIWHPPPYASNGPWVVGEDGGGWVEVMHKADPFGDEHYGAWFLYTKGSAVWYRIGRYITFDEHADAYNHFGANSNEDMCKAAAKADFDSVIFLKHVDHTNYPCDSAGRYPYMNVEIVAVKLVGTYACGSKGKPDMNVLRSGWATHNCDCDNQLGDTNCGSLHSTLVRQPSPERDRDAPLVPEQTVPTDCSTNHTLARDPAWFATCHENAGGGCIRVTVTSNHASYLGNLNIGNSTNGEQATLGFIWCIDHTNSVVYARLNATRQPDAPPYLAAYFEIDDDRHFGHSCRFLTTHWASGDSAQVYQAEQLNCTRDYTPTQLPGLDGVTNVTIRVEL